MVTLRELLELSAAQHHHLCPRQVLGVRMGILAGNLLGLELPQTAKHLLTFVETDGCFADGISAATGCTVGHRTLRVVDYGKVAATFVDTRTEAAFRVFPNPEVRQAAYRYAANAPSRWHAQLEAYQVMSDEELLGVQPVILRTSVAEIVSRPGVRVTCEACGEEIINEREVQQEGVTLCRACAEPAYYVSAVALPKPALLAGHVEVAHTT